jgi:hypothetical protein
MVIPFHSNATNELPVSIIEFLPSAALAQFGLINQAMHRCVKEELKKRKKAVVDPLIYYFYFDHYGKSSVTIRRRYDEHYYPYVRQLFRCLPELFRFLEINKIVRLDLGCVTDYGGYPESPYRMISSEHDELRAIAAEVLDLLSKNTTLIDCNLGLFQNIMGRKSIIEAVEKHPTLDYLSMLSNGARTEFREPPHTLYRNRRDRSFYWDRFRHDDGLKSDADV